MSTDLIVRYKGEEQVLQIDDRDVISFSDGLVGFSEWRRFVLLEDPDEAPIGVLQCIDDTAISFLVTDPWYVYNEYKPTLRSDDLSELGLDKLQDGRVLCILAAKEGPVLVTANLLGPIVINPETRSARQVILQDSPYSAQHPVLTVESADLGARR